MRSIANLPAFPLPVSKKNFDTTPKDFSEHHCGGLTIRQHASIEAMKGILANQVTGRASADLIAIMAVKAADAVIDELEKP